MLLKGLKKYVLKHWYLTSILLLSMLGYISVFISPNFFWPAVFVSYAIPGVLILNFILLIIMLFFKRSLVIIPLINLLMGLPFILITYSFKGEKTPESPDFSILSFNTKFFGKLKDKDEFSFDMIKWAAMDTSDIKCFQEYSTNNRWKVLDVTRQFSEQGYNYFTFSTKMKDANHNSGLAIFSKYKILDSGYVWQNHGSINAGIFVDINFRQDTISIRN